MTDPADMAEDASVGHDLATPPTPAAVQDLGTEGDPAVGQAPVTVAPRRRRRLVVALLGAVVVLGLAAGLVVWAPWIPPPVLRPTGLVADPSTANSIAFHWSRPPTGPLPDRYLILGYGMKTATVAGTATTYRQAGLTPSSPYQYRVVAVRGGKRSPQSATLTIRTVTPPISEARLQGQWQVYVKYLAGGPRSGNGYMTWHFTPGCAIGACDVMVDTTAPTFFSFKMKLTRAGAAYTGQAVSNTGRCGPRSNSIADPTTLKVQIRVNTALGQNQVWAAASLTGTMVGTSQYVSSGIFYCTATTFKTALNGSPS